MTDINEIEDYVVNYIDEAIANHWIEVYYQPVIRTITGDLCGSEALARWNDPRYGLLSPFHFVPALEKSGDIYKLDLYIIEEVCKDMHTALTTQCNATPFHFRSIYHDLTFLMTISSRGSMHSQRNMMCPSNSLILKSRKVFLWKILA